MENSEFRYSVEVTMESVARAVADYFRDHPDAMRVKVQGVEMVHSDTGGSALHVVVGMEVSSGMAAMEFSQDMKPGAIDLSVEATLRQP